jgi:hypothetical protein
MKKFASLGSLAFALCLASACTDSTSPILAPGSAATSKGSGGGGGKTSSIFINTASLQGTSLSISGVGATPNSNMTVNGVVMGTSNSSGSFTINNAAYTGTACSVVVGDASRATVTATLSPCTPGQTAPGSTPSTSSPVGGASVVQPFTLSWSQATAAQAAVAYNWQIATSSNFTQLVLQGSTNAPTTVSDALSGLPNGTYWWRVQQVSQDQFGNQTQDPWSSPASFVVNGSAAGTPDAPAFTFPANGAQYHPLEMFYPKWTSVANAASYRIEYSLDASFTPGSSEAGSRVTTATVDTMTFGNPITLFARVRGISGSGVLSVPSTPIKIVITYSAPIGPAPVLIGPANGAVVAQPIKFTWNDVQNPQLDGYTIMISMDKGFKGDCAAAEYCSLTVNGPSFNLADIGLTLPPGTHYWRVQSAQGDASPTTPALTAWSTVFSFIVK